MSRDSSEAINRIQGILTTLEQKRTDYERAKSDLMRLNIMLGKTMEAIQNSRRQLIAELAKLDPDGFAEVEVQEKRSVLELGIMTPEESEKITFTAGGGRAPMKVGR